jgi:hypothetical protein
MLLKKQEITNKKAFIFIFASRLLRTLMDFNKKANETNIQGKPGLFRPGPLKWLQNGQCKPVLHLIVLAF